MSLSHVVFVLRSVSGAPLAVTADIRLRYLFTSHYNSINTGILNFPAPAQKATNGFETH